MLFSDISFFLHVTVLTLLSAALVITLAWHGFDTELAMPHAKKAIVPLVVVSWSYTVFHAR